MACCSSAACFHALFASADQKEGMPAFLEKRAPELQAPLIRRRGAGEPLRPAAA